MIMYIITVCIVVCTCGATFAAPVITSTTISGATIAISGSDFGPDGPTIAVFDNFDDAGKLDGEAIDIVATVNSWDSLTSEYYIPSYSSTHRSGMFSGVMSAISTYNGTSYQRAGFDIAFTNCTEYFLSYAVQIPPGTYFPQYYESAPPGEFPNESAWKFAWIRDYENDPDASPGDDDMCIPQHSWEGMLWLCGNDLNGSNGDAYVTILDTDHGINWWQWGSWNRLTFWERADSDDPAGTNGIAWGQGISDGVEQYSATDTAHPVFASGTSPYQWNKLHINGWIRATDLSKPVKLLYDDIYFATGPNAAARVEIGNASTYSSCTKLAICTPTAWSDTSITATLRYGCFNGFEAVYVFVIDKDNNPSTGVLARLCPQCSDIGGNSSINNIGSGASKVTFK